MDESFKKQIQKKIFTNGPNRVMISAFETESLKNAVKQGFNPDIIFVRKDGWTLGVTKDLEWYAHEIWKDEWVYFVMRPNKELLPISKYKERN